MALIESAERLFALHGIEGVSVREIGQAIGSSNNNVVSYYFGNKESLVEQIYHHRLPGIDARRMELLAVADAAGRGNDLPTLMDALWRPLYEQTNQEGWHSYARFLLSLATSGWGETRELLSGQFQSTDEIVSRLKAHLDVHAATLFPERMRAISALLTSYLVTIDQAQPLDDAAKLKLYHDAVRMCVGAFATGANDPPK